MKPYEMMAKTLSTAVIMMYLNSELENCMCISGHRCTCLSTLIQATIILLITQVTVHKNYD